MNNNISNKQIHFIAFTVMSLFLIYYYGTDYLQYSIQTNIEKDFIRKDDNSGWILSPLLYKEMFFYVRSIHTDGRKENNVEKLMNRSLNSDYIKFIKEHQWKYYPFSTRTCSNTSNQELSTGVEYCLFTNIYYNSAADQYYFYQNPSDVDIISKAIEVDVSYGKLTLNIINDITTITEFVISAILTRPIYVGGPIDPNYAHGFLETFGPRFWTLSEIQCNGLFVDSSKIQIYYTSHMFKSNIRNWELYKRQIDGSYRNVVKWAAIVQSMFSEFPLLTYKSFNEKTVMFKYFLTTGNQVSRTPAWDYYYFISRSFHSHPFHTQQYRRAYLAYSEWILKNLNLPSKFELSPIQRQLQKSQTSESFPICDPTCKPQWNESLQRTETEFTGDWIVVVNRVGNGRREITNADELVKALIKIFPDQQNPYLRVYPKQLDFKDDLYQTARLARSTRLLIGVHGAGLANTIFMRPGTILYEINPVGCRKLSFNFHRWATIFNLQHALWSPSQKGMVVQDDACHNRQASITLVTSEIVKEVVNLIENEREYRDGYLRRALHLLNDSLLSDCPSFSKILQ